MRFGIIRPMEQFAISQGKAIVDARIAARNERKRARFELDGDACCKSVGMAPPDAFPPDRPEREASRFRPRRSPASGRFSAHLPDDLKVPSPEPRLPNLHAANLSFAARLLIAVRDKFAGNAPKVYAAANVSRQVYSQIVSDETRPVSKRTAIRFAFALKSTPEEARLLLKSAGYAFSNSQTEDFILQACLEVDPPIWDLPTVNRLLREYRVDFQY